MIKFYLWVSCALMICLVLLPYENTPIIIGVLIGALIWAIIGLVYIIKDFRNPEL